MKRTFWQISSVCLMGLFAQGQVDNQTQKFALDLLEHQTMTYGELRIISPIDSSFFIDGIEMLDSRNDYTFVVENRNYHDSITISEEEKQLIIAALKHPYSWAEGKLFPEKYKPLEKDSLMDYLADNRKNTIAVISKPVFLRNSTIAVAYFVNLCCGHVYGDLNFSFYKIENGVWTRWIDIRAGAF